MSSEQTTFMTLALDQAEKCIPSPTAFCVGCVMTVRWPEDFSQSVVLSTGYSRELPGNTHAEANALSKLLTMSSSDIASILGLPNRASPPTADELLTHVDVYTTLEPCSVRTSGLAPCSDALIEARIKRCYVGVGEPDDFVNCEGARKLVEAGIEVIWLKGMEDSCLSAARRGHTSGV